MLKLFKFSKRLTTSGVAKRGFATNTPGSILIKNGTVVNADRQFKADVVVQGDKIIGVYCADDKIGQ